MKWTVHLLWAWGLFALTACAPQANKPSKSSITVVVPSENSSSSPEPDVTEVLGGLKMIRSGQVQAAIDGPFNDVIRRYEAKYGSSKVKIYSARGLTDGLFYSAEAMAAKPPIKTIVLGPAWAMAYWGRGYAYNEMARYDDAIVELRKALVLAPQDAQYLVELAYAYQQKRDFSQSLVIYQSAMEFADITTGDVPVMKCTSLRGQGYDLVELHRLSEAEAAYHACLKIMPNELKSLGELDYIRQLRARQPHAKPG